MISLPAGGQAFLEFNHFLEIEDFFDTASVAVIAGGVRTVLASNDFQGGLPNATGTFQTVNLDLSNPTGGAILGSPTSAVLTIVDDDTSLQLASATSSVAEDGVSITLSVTRSGSTTGTVGVSYATSDQTALAGSDYVANSGTLSWGPGDGTPKTFSVTISDDSLAELDETFLATLSTPSLL